VDETPRPSPWTDPDPLLERARRVLDETEDSIALAREWCYALRATVARVRAENGRDRADH
jgi:hypothetical protein